MKKRIHVNQHHIRANAKNGTAFLPIFTVKTYQGNYKGNKLQIMGPATGLYQPEDPLPCGAKVWLETNCEVILDGISII